jgi:hypothetical protein
MKPDPNHPNRDEFIPEDVLPVDLIRRSVERMLVGEGDGEPSAPHVKIINLSICDRSRPYFAFMSPLARLLDWLCWEHRVLFVVSAGNIDDDIELPFSQSELNRTPAQELETATLRVLANDLRNRRLLAPAESINAITVGGANTDSSSFTPPTGRHLPLVSPSINCAYNSMGSGHRRAIKPDVLMPGGRQVYLERVISPAPPTTRLQILSNRAAPGLVAASPGQTLGVRTARDYSRGTSNATALVTRTSAKLHEVIQSLRTEPGGTLIQDHFLTVMIKALLVHGASWDEGYGCLESALMTDENRRKFRDFVGRFLGYGSVRPDRLYSCTDQRATILGCGELGDEEAHVYKVPLPPSLSGQAVERRLTYTLAWLTPINPRSQKYRGASLWVSNTEDEDFRMLNVGRSEADWQASRRGTVQHEILKGEKATAYVDGDKLALQVNCRGEAVKLIQKKKQINTQIPYGLIVTLEVPEDIDIPIYEEIRERVQAAIPVVPTA